MNMATMRRAFGCARACDGNTCICRLHSIDLDNDKDKAGLEQKKASVRHFGEDERRDTVSIR